MEKGMSKWKEITLILFSAIIACCILYIIRMRSEFAEVQESASQMQTAITSYRRTCDSLQTVNVQLHKSIDELLIQTDSLTQVKQTITIKYARNISNLRNPAIVGNDSIDRYIRSRLKAAGEQ
jgi:uncharacterized protein YpmS